MRQIWSAVERTALVGTCVGALIAGACGTSAAAPSGSVLQSAAMRHAYARMLADERSQSGEDAEKEPEAGSRPPEAGSKPPEASNKPPAGTQPTQPTHEPRVDCDAVTLGASPASPQSVGVTVVLTGAASGCPSPEFEFWIQPPSGKWSVLQAFSPNATANWHTAGLAQGTYALDVWARQAGSDGEKDVEISRIARYSLQASPACTSVMWNAPSLPSPQSPGSKVGLSGTASGCTSPLYQFRIQPPGGQWAILQPYSPSSAAIWDTTGLVLGTYTFDIWVKQSGSAALWEANVTPNPTYTLQSAGPCNSITWNTPNPAGPQAPGAQISFGGVAGGCLNPQYQFWIQPPGGQWTIVQPYSSSSTLVWNTSGAATGTYLFDIWVKQLGSSAGWETHISPNPTYVLQTGPPCTSATLAFSPTSPTKAGASIQLTATSSGCPSPSYQFWVLAPGGGWTILQSYSASATATWNTTGFAPGTYLFDVYVRQAGNSAPYEAHIAPNPTYTLS